MEKVDKRREKIYVYIRDRINAGSSPTVREICAGLNIPSTSTVHADLKALCDAGLIEMTGRLNRTIRLPGASAAHVPLLGTVAAGVPILAVQNIENYISVSLTVVKGKELFALRIKGDSMVKAAMLDGDIIVAERAQTAENGDIIVAMLGDEATVKRFYKEDGHFRLQPENDDMQPIIVSSVEILGRVLCVQRFYV